MGIVVEAHDPELGRTVALKVLARPDANALERLRREARAMAALEHANVVSLYEVGEDQGQVFLVMPWVRGGNLRSVFDDPAYAATQRQPTETEHLKHLLLDAARGLSAAHAAGLVHRDFKPENVLIDQHGHALVGDFGIATEPLHTRAASLGAITFDPAEPSLTQTGALIGTPAYMAPEQLRGEPATAKSDQFAYCVTAFEAFEGERPFVGGSVDALSAAMLNRPIFRQTPDDWQNLIAQGLASRAADRFDSMNALLAALKTADAHVSQPSRILRPLLLLSVAILCVFLGTNLFAKGPELRVSKDTHAISRLEIGGLSEGLSEGGNEGLTRWQADWIAEVDAQQDDDAALACLRGRAWVAASLAHDHASARWLPARWLPALPPVVGCSDHSGKHEPILAQLAELRARAYNSEDLRGSLDRLEASVTREYARNRIRLFSAEVARRAGRSDEAIALLSQVQTYAETARVEVLQLRAWLERAKTEGASARFQRAAESLGHASALAARVDRYGEFEADIANTNGAILYGQGQFDEASEALEQARQLRVERLGEDHPAVGAVLTNLANLARARGDFERAFSLHSDAMAIERSHSEHPSALAVHEHNLGGVRREQGRLEDARGHYERALELGGETGRSRGLTLNSLGLVAAAQGNLAEAEQYYVEAEQVFRDRRHQDVALVLYNRGQVALRRHLPLEAQRLFESALAEDRQRMGTDAPRVAKDLMGLGDAYRQAGRHRIAEATWRDALVIARGPRMQQSPHGPEVRGELLQRLTELARPARPARPAPRSTRVVRIGHETGEPDVEAPPNVEVVDNTTPEPDEPEESEQPVRTEPTAPPTPMTGRGSAAYGATQAWD